MAEGQGVALPTRTHGGPCLTLTLLHGDDITSRALSLHKSPFPGPGKDFPKPRQNGAAALEQPLSETQERLCMSGRA